MHYVIINKIYANKPHRLRLPEAMRGNGGQTKLQKSQLRFQTEDSQKIRTRTTVLQPNDYL